MIKIKPNTYKIKPAYSLHEIGDEAIIKYGVNILECMKDTQIKQIINSFYFTPEQILYFMRIGSNDVKEKIEKNIDFIKLNLTLKIGEILKIDDFGVCQASCPILIKKIFIPFFLYQVINNKFKLLNFLELFIMSFPLSPVAYATGERGNDIKV
jgi:hypothetical protein